MEELKTDLNKVNEDLTKKVEELNRINNVREQLIQQIQQLNGVAMYLRGKVASDGTETQDVVKKVKDDSSDKGNDTFERSVEYPPTKKK